MANSLLFMGFCCIFIVRYNHVSRMHEYWNKKINHYQQTSHDGRMRELDQLDFIADMLYFWRWNKDDFIYPTWKLKIKINERNENSIRNGKKAHKALVDRLRRRCAETSEKPS